MAQGEARGGGRGKAALLSTLVVALGACGGGGSSSARTEVCASPRPFEVPSGPFQWTPIVASADTRRVYLSSSGDDENDCLSELTACETPARAIAQLRDGYPDHLLIRRGDTFEGPLSTGWSLSGRSAAEPMVIATYGESGARPYFRTGEQTAFRTYHGTPVRHLRIMDLRFHANVRDPGDASFVVPTASSEAPVGFIMLSSNHPIEDVLIEGCEVSHYNGGLVAHGPATVKLGNVRLRANHFHDAYAVNHDGNGDGDSDDGAGSGDIHQGHSAGIYTDRVDGLLLEQNVFDHNGGLNNYPGDPRRVDLPGIQPAATAGTWFNHQIYSDSNNCHVVAVGNVFANGDGVQLRSGGIARENVFVRTVNAITGGNDDVLESSGGFTFEIRDNLFLEGTDFAPESIHGPSAPRGNGVLLTNVSDAGARIVDNLFLRDISAAQYGRAIQLEGGNRLGNGETGVVRSAEIARNTVVNWRGGIVLIGTPGRDLRSTTVHDNVVQNPRDTQAWLTDMEAPGGSHVVWSRNAYHSGRTDGRWFAQRGVGVDSATWSELAGEEGSTLEARTFANPGARFEEAVLGAGAAYEAAWPRLRAQTRWSWDPSLETRSLIARIRTDLGLLQ